MSKLVRNSVNLVLLVHHLAVFAGRDEDINAVHLSLCECCGLELPFLGLRGVENNALLAVNYILALLAREHACQYDLVVRKRQLHREHSRSSSGPPRETDKGKSHFADIVHNDLLSDDLFRLSSSLGHGYLI